ncbi:FAD-linked oxidoreductase-like protein [Elaphomyces granulatus]
MSPLHIWSRTYSMNRISDLPSRKPTSSLSILPLSTITRSFFVTTVSSSPLLLSPALAMLSFLAESKSAFLDPDQNALLKQLLTKTLYAQFCAGETPDAVRRTIHELKNLGYSGIILGYAKEAVMDGNEVNAAGAENIDEKRNAQEILAWKDGTMKTVNMATNGDFVALKFSGAGRQALQHLVQGLSPSPELETAIVDICETARQRGARLLFDAEQQAIQKAIDAWVLRFQRRYNASFGLRGEKSALVYGTYQAYLHSTPATLSQHLAAANNEGFTLGVKLVRGAYLGIDPRHLIHQTKEDTDTAYDNIAESLIMRKYGSLLTPPSSSSLLGSLNEHAFPQVNLVLATHNWASIRKARSLRDQQTRCGKPLIEMAYGQLQGMADDVSCQLVRESNNVKTSDHRDAESPKTYKYLVWGTVGECTKYILRRGQENRDAVLRTENTRRAMFAELKRRWAQNHWSDS